MAACLVWNIDFQVAKDELEKQQRELHEMMQRLEESKNLEAEERARLEEEILQKKNEVIHAFVLDLLRRTSFILSAF